MTTWKSDISESDIFKAWHFWRWHSESLTFLKMRIIKSDISERDIYNIWHFWKSFAKNFNHPKHDPKILLLNITPLYDPFIWSLHMIPQYDPKLTIFPVHSRWPQLRSNGRIHSLRHCSPWLISRQQLPRLHCFSFHRCCWENSTKYNVRCSRCLLWSR